MLKVENTKSIIVARRHRKTIKRCLRKNLHFGLINFKVMLSVSSSSSARTLGTSLAALLCELAEVDLDSL